MGAKGRKVKALNPSTKTFDDGIVVGESVFRRTYDIKFSTDTSTVSKSRVQFLPA